MKKRGERRTKSWRKARKAAGIEHAHFHDLRHAGLTLSAQVGATLAEVMRRAGHSSAAAAIRYQHAPRREAAFFEDEVLVGAPSDHAL